MKKIKIIIFSFYLLVFSMSLFISLYLFLSGFKTTSSLFYFSTICLALFGSSFYLLKHIIDDYVIPYILNEKIDVKVEMFQLDSEIKTISVNNKIVCQFSMNSIGKKIFFTIDMPKKIISPQEFIIGTLKIKPNCNYRVSFLVKQYQYQNETFDHQLEPISIDHESLENYLIRYHIKHSNKIRPKIYLVK